MLYFKTALALLLVMLMHDAAGQLMEINGGLYVKNDGTDTHGIAIEGLGTDGGTLILKNAPDSGDPANGEISIKNGDGQGGQYDLFITADNPNEDRWLKIVNKAPGNDVGGNLTFGMIIDGGIDFIPIQNDNERPPVLGIYAKLQSSGIYRMYARDTDVNDTVFSSHVSPESVDQGGRSSFSNVEIELPFSFTHQNALIGKGQTIDMAKIVHWVQQKMVQELGEEEGKVVYTYEIPESEKMTLEEYRYRKQLFELKLLEAGVGWQQVELGPNQELPQEAFIEVEEIEPVERERIIEEDVIDFANERVVKVERRRKFVENVRTGRTSKRLKPSYQFVNGKLFHSPAIEQLGQSLSVDGQYDPPSWVRNRLPSQ